jgi:hypothetical protein
VLGEGSLLLLLGRNMVEEYLVVRHRQFLGLSRMMGQLLKIEDDRLLHLLLGGLFGELGSVRMTWLLGNALTNKERF